MNRAEKAKVTWIERELERRFEIWKVPQAVMTVRAGKEEQEFLINYFASRQSYKTMQIIEDGTIKENLVIYVSI